MPASFLWLRAGAMHRLSPNGCGRSESRECFVRSFPILSGCVLGFGNSRDDCHDPVGLRITSGRASNIGGWSCITYDLGNAITRCQKRRQFDGGGQECHGRTGKTLRTPGDLSTCCGFLQQSRRCGSGSMSRLIRGTDATCQESISGGSEPGLRS